jgi:hypothetical protein
LGGDVVKRYYFEVNNVDDQNQLVTIYAEINGKFVSLSGPYNMHDEDEAFALVGLAAGLESSGYTYVKMSEL